MNRVSLKHAQDAHTNITVLEMIQNIIETGYRGTSGISVSDRFSRSIIRQIQAEQFRLLDVMDKHTERLTKESKS